jgi:hypothetical protein
MMTVDYVGCIQDSQELGSDDEHMVSRVFFGLKLDEAPKGDFITDLKQAVGDTFEGGTIEVGPPTGLDGSVYTGPFSQQNFADETASYFRGLVGSAGRAISVGPGAGNVRMMNNTYEAHHSVTFEVSDLAGIW